PRQTARPGRPAPPRDATTLRPYPTLWRSPEVIAGRRLPPDPAYGAVQHRRKDARAEAHTAGTPVTLDDSEGRQLL
ncbi:hypothetical protein, partial [Raoultella ornithinolytica]|uniref:hypothetical protein n=1 Tax=Raoultella ornithinolytica TaxID=54291 RepID=UPI00194FD8D0